MRITDVLRGDDLLDSTPRQTALAEALGLPEPRYAHIPLLFGEDGRRLAKRHGNVAVAAMRAAGTAPERAVGWLAHWSGLIHCPEPLKAADLIVSFNLGQVPREPVIVRNAVLRELAGG